LEKQFFVIQILQKTFLKEKRGKNSDFPVRQKNGSCRSGTSVGDP
jgi:hypothetical protein